MRGKSLLTAVALSSVIVGGIVGIASPANAAYTDCAKGNACMWNGTSYPGSPGGSFAYGISAFSAGFDNVTDSIVNNGYAGALSTACFYQFSNYGGDVICLDDPASGYQWRDPDLSNGVDANPIAFANKISSAKFV